MPGAEKRKLEIAHVLFMDIVGYSKLLIDEQSEALQELNQIVGNTEALREGEAAGQLIILPTGDDMAPFFTGSVEDFPYTMAQIGVLTSDKEMALTQLAIAAQTPSSLTYGELRFGPEWDPLRSDPRFDKILASLAPK